MPDEVELSGGDAAPVVLGEAWPRWWRWTSSVEVAVEVEGLGRHSRWRRRQSSPDGEATLRGGGGQRGRGRERQREKRGVSAREGEILHKSPRETFPRANF